MLSILVFGGGELQVSLINTVKKLGFTAIVIDPDPNAKARQLADYFYTIPGDDFAGTLEVALRHKVRALMTTATDNPILMMAKIAEHLNLKFPSFESVSSVLDKSTFKELMLENDIKCAKGYSFHVDETPARIDLRFPVILKPNKNSGSRGVIKCDSYKEVLSALPEISCYCKDGHYIVEEFIDGDEISVEAFVQDGRLEIVQITDKVVGPPPYNVEMAHVQPSKYIPRQSEIRSVINSIIVATGLDQCALHPELKINDNGIYVIEVGPRLGGDFITSDLVPLSTGTNMEEGLIDISLGKVLKKRQTDMAAVIRYLSFAEGSVVDRSGIMTSLSQNRDVVEFSIYVQDNEKVRPITSSLNRHGYFIMTGRNLADTVLASERLARSIEHSYLNKEELC